MSIMDSAPNRLRETVRQAGIKQKDLAVALEVSEATVSKILSGQRQITIPTARRIVDALRRHTGRRRGYSLDALFGRAA